MNRGSGEKTLEQVLAGLVQRMERGEPVDADEILLKHPHIASELGEFIECHSQFIATAEKVRGQLSDLETINSTDSTGYGREDSLAATLTRSATQGTDSTQSNLPRIFGDYEIIEEIDRGGMGIVFKARHLFIDRIVALKVIRSGEFADELEVQRFRSEAEAAAALAHPGIVPIYDVGTCNDLAYYTMPYIEGQSLEEVVANNPMDAREAMRIANKLCSAVDFAHSHGVYHRDLKPANVLLDASGQPIIIDFGLAKTSHADHGLTATGQILGTPAYMAPESAKGQKTIGPASDVYSLGAMLYCMLAGQPPFSGPTPFDVLLQVLDRDPPAPSRLNRHVGSELDFVCRKALQKDPKARYESAAKLGRDLQSILQDEPIECPSLRVGERLESWWRREPILVAHVCGIGVTTLIVGISFWVRGESAEPFPLRIGLLVLWFMAAFWLQSWVVRAKWRDLACLAWATVDVLLYTTLIAFAGEPRTMLLIGYPMLIVASSLFYRKRFVLYMTGICIAGFLSLALFAPQGDFVRPDFAAIFVSGLCVISLSLLAMIRRVRGLSSFYEDAV